MAGELTSFGLSRGMALIQGGGVPASAYAASPAPSGFVWDFVTYRGERVTKSNEPVVALVRAA